MRSDAKAPSAGPTMRQATALGRIFRGAFATRGASRGSDGSGAPSYRRVRLATGQLVAAFAFLALAAGASASITTRYPASPVFGPDGTDATAFSQVESLAVEQATHRLFAFDRPAAKIDAFDTPGPTPPGGAFPLSVASQGRIVAVDSTVSPSASAGNIYYLRGQAVYGFDASGAALGGNFPISLPSGFACGLAVDSTGTIFVSDTDNHVLRKYDAEGNSLGTSPVSSELGACQMAFDASDNLFFGTVPRGSASSAVAGVYEYTAASGYDSSAAIKVPWVTAEPAWGVSPNLVAVDGSRHTLYIGERHKILAYDTEGGTFPLLYEFAEVEDAAGAFPSGPQALAIDEATDTAYVATYGKVYAFPPAQSFPDATATTTPATGITDTSAEIGATVTDNSVLPTNWRLELSTNGGSTWEPVASGRTASKSAAVASTGFSAGWLTVEAVGGTFTLAVEGKTTSALSYNASASAVQSALEALPAIGSDNVEVTGGPGDATGSTPYTITFVGSLSGTNVGEIAADPARLVGGPETVTASLTGLDPNTEYEYRVVTNKGLGAGTEIASGPAFFRTVAPPPVITDVGAVQVDDTSARLIGTIDPRNTDTGYVFEYGPTPALGSATAPLGIGGGTTPITVSQVVGGLFRNTTYYFRLVATNLAGTTTSASHTVHTRSAPFPPANPGGCPNEGPRVEQASTYLPDCRAYEMVTPPDKNQGSAAGVAGSTTGQIGEDMRMGFSTDGSGVAFCTSSLFGEPPAQQSITCAPYLSRRQASGWNSKSPFPRYCGFDDGSSAKSTFTVAYSPRSYDRLALSVSESEACAFPPLDPAAPLPAQNFYREDLTTDPFAFDLLTPVSAGGVGLATESGHFAGGSADFSHVVFGSDVAQTAGSPSGSFQRLYDWQEDGSGACTTLGGCLSLLSVKPDGTPFTTGSTPPGYEADAADFALVPNAVSEDGRRIYFQNQSSNLQVAAGGCETAACNLYMREDASTTFDVSASECSEECGVDSSPDRFVWANPAGDDVFFESCAKLTDDAGPAHTCTGTGNSPESPFKLYRWDRNAPPGNRLALVGEATDGVIGASSDANTVFFVGRAQLVAGGPTGEVSGAKFKLFRWRWNGGAPGIDYLGPYQSSRADGGTANELGFDPNRNYRHIRVTPDGRYVMIQTAVRLDPAADRDADADIYRWDEADGWTCISCQLPGAPSAGNADSFEPKLLYSFINKETAWLAPEHSISDDGQRIFFSTPDALVPQDVNGASGCPVAINTFQNGVAYACQDVYEWHDGTVSLLTSGTGDKPFVLIGATHDGRNVFVATQQRLLGWDVDNGVDIYDVRVGGGFPEPAPQPAACEGEACRGAGSSQSSLTGAGTAAFEGSGNVARRSRCAALAQRVRRLSRGAKRLRRHAGALARRARRVGGSAKARPLRRRAHRLALTARRRAHHAQALARRAKRCRHANGRAAR